MKAGLVVPRIDRLRDLAFDLDAEVIGKLDITARGFPGLADGQRGGQCRRGRVRQQAVDTRLGDGQLGVVVVVGVDRDTVGERGKARGQLQAGADHRGRSGSQVQACQMLDDELARMRDRARQREAKPVEDRLAAERHDVGGKGAVAGARHELRDVLRDFWRRAVGGGRHRALDMAVAAAPLSISHAADAMATRPYFAASAQAPTAVPS